MNSQILILPALALLAVSAPHAFGHGLGLDTTPPIAVDGREISVSVEIPSYYDETGERQVTISATDGQSGESVPNVTYLVGLFHDGEMIFRNYFFGGDGTVSMNVKYSDGDAVIIDGGQDSLLGAWHPTPEQPLEITGPVFESGGLYTFEIEIRTVDEPTNVIEDLGVYTADVTIVETEEFFQKDGQENDVKFRTKSYFDSIGSFEYDPATRTVTFEMPFDWKEERISHIPVVHEEVHFPKEFLEFLAPGYSGRVNGVELFKSSVVVDDYTEESERIVHFVLLQDHLRYIKNQLKQSGGPIGDRMVFTLQTNDVVELPVSAWTRDESFKIDLSWDPLEIVPGQETKFVFTIRDGATDEPLRNSAFDFVILQNGEEIHREGGNAQVGGDFVDYMFGEDQTGPTVIRFEDIRGSGKSTEFGIVVAPEFGVIASLVLVAGMSSAVLLGRRLSPRGWGLR